MVQSSVKLPSAKNNWSDLQQLNHRKLSDRLQISQFLQNHYIYNSGHLNQIPIKTELFNCWPNQAVNPTPPTLPQQARKRKQPSRRLQHEVCSYSKVANLRLHLYQKQTEASFRHQSRLALEHQASSGNRIFSQVENDRLGGKIFWHQIFWETGEEDLWLLWYTSPLQQVPKKAPKSATWASRAPLVPLPFRRNYLMEYFGHDFFLCIKYKHPLWKGTQ